MTVGGKRVILRLLQLQLGDDGIGAAVEYLIDRVGDRFVAVLGGAERVHHDGNGLGYADGIGELYLTFFGNAGCDHVFGDVARIVCRAAVNLCRVLAAERAAAVTGKAAVGVNNDLSAGQTRVADGAADDESAGGIDKNLGIPEQLRRNDGIDHIRDHILADLLARHIGVVLGRYDDRVHTHCLAVLILHGHLRFAVGTQIGQRAVLAHLGELLGELVRQRDRQRHQLGRFVAGVAEHHALVAGADEVVDVGFAVLVLKALVHAHGDIRRLAVERGQHGAACGVKAIVGVGVADVLDHPARHSGDVHLRGGGDFAHDVHNAGGDGRFAGNMRFAVLRENAVEDRVGYFVTDLVGMSLGHRFGCK